MYRCTQIALILLLPFIVSAQSLSNNSRFSVEFDRGCAPMTVDISELDTLGNVTRQYFYFNGASVTSSTTFTYDTIGFYQIVQILDGILADTLEVEVLEARRPEVSVIQCGNFEISVMSQDSYYDSVRIYFGGADSITLLTNQIATYQFDSGGNQTYGLKGLFDNADEICETYFEETTPLPDINVPTILAASVKETCQDIYSLYLTMDQVQVGVSYSVILDQNNSIVTLYDGFLDSTNLVFGNIPFDLSEYCVQVEWSNPCNQMRGESNQLCNVPTSLSLSPFETLYSTYQNASIYINLDQVSSGMFEVERRFEGGNFEPRGSKNGSFNDPIGSQTRKYFYRINYIDSCGSILFTANTHPPLIDAEEATENQYEVFFIQGQNSLQTFEGATYEVGIENRMSTGDINSSPFEVNLSANNGVPRQELRTLSNFGSSLELVSNTLSLKYELAIYVPNAFTPNGDGLNDELEFFGVPTENASVRIYSQWGDTIYESNNLSEGWDGMTSGSRAPVGNYLYEIQFETTNGRILKQRGTFALIIN